MFVVVSGWAPWFSSADAVAVARTRSGASHNSAVNAVKWLPFCRWVRNGESGQFACFWEKRNTISSNSLSTSAENGSSAILVADNSTVFLEERKRVLEKNYFSYQFIPRSSLIYGTAANSMISALDYSVASSTTRDCIGITNGNTSGGDLLHSLSGDIDFRSVVELRALSVAYAISLQDTVDRYIDEAYTGHDFFAYYVCHMQSGLDVVAGYVWPDDTSPYEVVHNAIDINKNFFTRAIVLIVNGRSVYEVSEVDTLPVESTPDNAGLCHAAQDSAAIQWSCYSGKTTESATSTMTRQWTITMKGVVIGQRDVRTGE